MYPYPSTAQSPSAAASAAGASSAVINNGLSAPCGEANTTAYHSPEELRVLNIDPQATKGLFVGDLSSFCSEKDLYAMFVPFGPILAIEIKRGRHGDSLLHGFVEYDSVVSSFHAVEAMHGRKIMGRRMRVNWTNIKVPPKPVESWTLVQVHFVSKNIQLRIDEEFLDNVFAPFGDVIDVIVKRHEIRQSPPQIRGYGNVYFLDPIPAMKAIMSMKGVSVSGVQFECSLTMPKSGSMSNANSHTNSGMNSGFNSGFNSGTMTPTPGGNNANIISNNMHNNMINNNNNNNSTGSGNLLQQALSGMSGFSGTGTPPPPPLNTTSPSMSHLHRMTTPGSASSAINNNNSNNNSSNAAAFMAGTNKNTHSSSSSHALSSSNNNASANSAGEASTSGINFASSATAQQQRLLYLLEKEKELIRREKELLLREQLAVQLGYYDLNHPQLSQLNNTNNNTNINNAEEDNRNILHLPSNNNNNNANGANNTHSKLSVSPQMSPHFINNMTNNNNNNNTNNNLSSSKSSKDSSAFSFDFIPHIPSAPQSTTTSFYQSNTSNNNTNNNTNNNNTSSSNTGVSKHPSIIAGLSLNTSSWDLNDPLYALSHSSSQPNVFLNMNNISNFPTLNNNNMYPHYNNYSQGNSQANSAFNSGYNSGVISHTGSTSSQSTATHASVGHGSRFTFDHIPLNNNNVAIATPGTQQPSLPPTPSSSGHSNKLKPPLAMSPSHAKEFTAGFFTSNNSNNSGDTLGNVVGVSHNNHMNNNNNNINNEDIFAAAFSKMGIAEEYNALTNDPATDETRHQFGALETQQHQQQGHSSSSSTVDDLLDAMIDEDATRGH